MMSSSVSVSEIKSEILKTENVMLMYRNKYVFFNCNHTRKYNGGLHVFVVLLGTVTWLSVTVLCW
jgi:hypothetical protein